MRCLRPGVARSGAQAAFVSDQVSTSLPGSPTAGPAHTKKWAVIAVSPASPPPPPPAATTDWTRASLSLARLDT